MIKTEQLTKQFDRVLAVDHLSIEVGEGEVLGFLGPNGAGKTTTVRMLTSLIGPSSGTAIVNGYTIGKDDQDIRRTVGILTESPGFYDNLSALQNLMIYARLYGVADPDAQVKKYLDMLGLWPRRFDETGAFSKGMKQRLAIARALLHEPSLIFLDEPTSGLDPEAAVMVREFILELKNLNRTIFLCTHNLDEADRLCDRVAVFKTRLLVIDTPARLRSGIFGRKVVFHLAKSYPDLDAEIQKFDFVSSTSQVENKLIVGLEQPEAYNPILIRHLVDLGVDIQFVGELRRSLEDVYLELVRA